MIFCKGISQDVAINLCTKHVLLIPKDMNKIGMLCCTAIFSAIDKAKAVLPVIV